MDYKNIIKEVTEKTCLITINRPKFLNSLNNETIHELSDCINSINSDNNISSVIITGAENKSFVAGADIKEFKSFNKKQGYDLSKNGHDNLFDLIESSNKPFIAAINGFALGGGLELAMACHIRLASENAKLGLPEVTLGVIPGYGGTQRLPQLVGKGIAMEMILSGKMISADKALKYGLINYVCGQEDLIHQCEKIANSINKNSSSAISNAIKAVNAGYKAGTNGLNSEIELFASCFETDDFVEGTNAFLEKRKPNFN